MVDKLDWFKIVQKRHNSIMSSYVFLSSMLLQVSKQMTGQMYNIFLTQ